MANGKRTGWGVAWTTGTTVASGSLSLTAGDIIIMSAAFDPAANNTTFSKTAGTGAIGAITTKTKLTNGVMSLTTAYCSVTTTGTVTITATSSTTVTNGVFCGEVYTGASGCLTNTAGGTGASGTTGALTINNAYQNSWQVMVMSLVGNNPAVPVASTNVTAIEQSIAANISGTTNDLAIGIGAHEVATAPGNITLTMTKGNGVTYCADIVELVNQFTISAGGGAAGGSADKVLTNFKSVTETEQASLTALTSGYKFFRTVTIDPTKVGTVDAANFPMLFGGTYTYLKTVANGGKVTNASGFDIIFTSDAKGATKLDHEIESYNGTTGAVALWVRVPTVSHTINTTIYLWYGNSGISSSQEVITGVWGSSFKMVWHLPNGTTLTAADSTSNTDTGVLVGTPLPSAVAGQMDGGASFDGSQNYIKATNVLSFTADYTLSCWFKTSTAYTSGTSPTNAELMGAASAANDIAEIGFGNAAIVGADNTAWGFVKTGGVSQGVTSTKGSLNDGVYHYIVTGRDTSNRPYISVDNETIVVGTANAGTVSPGVIQAVGCRNFNGTFGGFVNGSIDEPRIRSAGITQDQITAEYNNQKTPSTFYTLGNEGWATSPAVTANLKSVTVTDSASATKIANASKSVTVTIADSIAKIASSVFPAGSRTQSAREAATAVETVPTNLKNVTVTESASATKVASSIKSLTVSESASATKIASSVKAITATESGSATTSVTTNLKSVTVTQSASAAKVASSVKAASGSQSASSTRQVLTNLKAATVFQTATASAIGNSPGVKSVSVTESGSAVVTVTTNKKAVTVTVSSAPVITVSHNAKGVSVISSGIAAPKAMTNLTHLFATIGASVVVTGGGGGPTTTFDNGVMPVTPVLTGGVPIEEVIADVNGIVPIKWITDGSQAVPVRLTSETFNNLVPTKE